MMPFFFFIGRARSSQSEEGRNGDGTFFFSFSFYSFPAGLVTGRSGRITFLVFSSFVMVLKRARSAQVTSK